MTERSARTGVVRRDEVVACFIQDIEYRKRRAFEIFCVFRGVVREVLRIQQVIIRAVGVEVDKFRRQRIRIGFEGVNRIDVQLVFTGDVNGFEPSRQNADFEGYHLTVEDGIYISVSALFVSGAVVDIEFGVGGKGVGRIVEAPIEGTHFRGSVFLGVLFAVDLGEVETHGVMTEVPFDERRPQFFALELAQRVRIIGAEHQINVRIDVYRIGYRDVFREAVGGDDIDEFIGIYLPVQHLYAHVFAVGRHHAVADYDVDDIDSAVYGDVLPACRTEGIPAVVAHRNGVGEDGVVKVEPAESRRVGEAETFLGSVGTALPSHARIGFGGEVAPDGDDVLRDSEPVSVGEEVPVLNRLGVDVPGYIQNAFVVVRFVVGIGVFHPARVVFGRLVGVIDDFQLGAVDNNFPVFADFGKFKVVARRHGIEVPCQAVLFYRQRVYPRINYGIDLFFRVRIGLGGVGDHHRPALYAEADFVQLVDVVDVDRESVGARYGLVDGVFDDVVIALRVI